MDISKKYIPREYLALKINYCRKQLAELPEVTLHEHIVDGVPVKRVSTGGHRYSLNSETGQQLYKCQIKRDSLERDLHLYEAVWNYNYKGVPPTEFTPRKISKKLAVDYNQRIVMDKTFFENSKMMLIQSIPKPPVTISTESITVPLQNVRSPSSTLKWEYLSNTSRK